ncbi:MAG: S8 family serine peptidase [Myxococcaceae bacterium]
MSFFVARNPLVRARGALGVIKGSLQQVREGLNHFEEEPIHLFGFHGTAVTGVAMANLPPKRSRLLFIPIEGDTEGAWPTPEKWFETVSNTIRAGRATVVNMSSGGQEHAWMIQFFRAVDLHGSLSDFAFKKVLPDRALDGQEGPMFWENIRSDRSLQTKIRERNCNLMEELFAAHPDVLFVLAAGNTGQKVVPSRARMKGYGRDNVLRVAAAGWNGKFASLSDYSPQHVHLAAPGIKVPASNVLNPNKPIRMSGTSLSAPLVTNRVARIVDQHGRLPIKDLRQLLFEQTVSMPGLKSKVAGGRFLVPEEFASANPKRVAKLTEDDWKPYLLPH